MRSSEDLHDVARAGLVAFAAGLLRSARAVAAKGAAAVPEHVEGARERDDDKGRQHHELPQVLEHAYRHDEERPRRGEDEEDLHQPQPGDEGEEGLARQGEAREGRVGVGDVAVARAGAGRHQQDQQHVQDVEGVGEVPTDPHPAVALHVVDRLLDLTLGPADQVEEQRQVAEAVRVGVRLRVRRELREAQRREEPERVTTQREEPHKQRREARRALGVVLARIAQPLLEARLPLARHERQQRQHQQIEECQPRDRRPSLLRAAEGQKTSCRWA